jgi:hypothetical protein
MAFIRTIDVVTTNGNTYDTSEEFTAEHGPMGTENTNYITDSSITLNEAKDGVRIVLHYVDEATWQSPKDAAADDVAAKDITISEVSNETV